MALCAPENRSNNQCQSINGSVQFSNQYASQSVYQSTNHLIKYLNDIADHRSRQVSSKVVRRERKFSVSVNCPFFSLVFVGPATRPTLSLAPVSILARIPLFIASLIPTLTRSTHPFLTDSVHTPIPPLVHTLTRSTHPFPTHSHTDSVHTPIYPLVHLLLSSPF